MYFQVQKTYKAPYEVDAGGVCKHYCQHYCIHLIHLIHRSVRISQNVHSFKYTIQRYDAGERCANITVIPPHPPLHSNEANIFYLPTGVLHKLELLICSWLLGRYIFILTLRSIYLSTGALWCALYIVFFLIFLPIYLYPNFEVNIFTSLCALYIVSAGNLLLLFV